MMLTSLAALVATTFASRATATFVVQCTSRLIDERIDPLVYPGEISDHVHAIAGGSNFDITLDYPTARASPCSTCNIKEDLSNYWTPKLYYHAQNGSFISVPIDGDDALGNMGGMAIYYLPRTGQNNDQLVPFPKGFRMFAGDTLKRAETTDFAGQAVRHRCVGTDGEFTSLPNKKCPEGVRTEVVFPSCWDGKNLDSPDHKSHMSYPASGNFDGGPCPASHPVHFLTLFYEVTYRTDQFEWYNDTQPFVFANGDTTGYSFHGDFINGWDVDKLAEAIAKCPDGSHACDPNGGVFTFNTPADRQACKLPQRVPEQVSGVLDALPGCNPVTMDPIAGASCPRNPKILTITSASTPGAPDLSQSKGWTYLGCGMDDPIAWGSRALTGSQPNIQNMTIEKCVDECFRAGFSYAGLEYASECYCGNTIDSRAAPKAGVLGNCNMPCAGDGTEFCGGSKAITLYQKCDGGKCVGAPAPGTSVVSPEQPVSAPGPPYTSPDAPTASPDAPITLPNAPIPSPNASVPSPESPDTPPKDVQSSSSSPVPTPAPAGPTTLITVTWPAVTTVYACPMLQTP